MKYRLKWPRTPRTPGGFAIVNSAEGVKRALSPHTISQAKRLRGHVEGCAIAKKNKKTVMCIMWAQYGGGGVRAETQSPEQP